MHIANKLLLDYPPKVHKMSDQYWHMSGSLGLFARATLRTLQFTFAVIVAALYGIDLSQSTSTNTHANSAWVFAEVVATLSIITCGIHCLVAVKRVAWCAWDWVLFILWVAQFGVFGAIYLGGKDLVNGQYTQSVTRMKVTDLIDGLNMMLWFTSAVGGVVWCCVERKFTRRTDVMDLSKKARLSLLSHLNSLAKNSGSKESEEDELDKEPEKGLKSSDGDVDGMMSKGDDTSST